MWKNSELKENAKSVLKRFGYWNAFLASLLTALLAANFSEIISTVADTPELESLYENEQTAPVIGIAMLLLSAFSLLWGIFIANPILVGQNRFYMENRIFGSKIERIFWVFKSGNYMNVVKIMFLVNLKIFLWSLLFIIPGIIKSYQYYMVPYILAENPGISSERAFELSSEMTKEEKFSIFCLELSFFGWMMLGYIACGIGLFFLNPYMLSTFAELYQVMREKAHSCGFSDFTELPGFFPEQR